MALERVLLRQNVFFCACEAINLSLMLCACVSWCERDLVSFCYTFVLATGGKDRGEILRKGACLLYARENVSSCYNLSWFAVSLL